MDGWSRNHPRGQSAGGRVIKVITAMQYEPDPKILSKFLTVSAVMVALFAAACLLVALFPFALRMIMGRH
jgi:hypothetical protein